MRELLEQRNLIDSKIFILQRDVADEYFLKLITEMKNLQEGVGNGFTEADYYAPTRYYSELEGVKNLRFDSNGNLCVKVLDRKAFEAMEFIMEYYELPGNVELRIYKSKNYEETVNF